MDHKRLFCASSPLSRARARVRLFLARLFLRRGMPGDRRHRFSAFLFCFLSYVHIAAEESAIFLPWDPSDRLYVLYKYEGEFVLLRIERAFLCLQEKERGTGKYWFSLKENVSHDRLTIILTRYNCVLEGEIAISIETPSFFTKSSTTD